VLTHSREIEETIEEAKNIDKRKAKEREEKIETEDNRKK